MKKYWFAALICILVGGTAQSQDYGDTIDLMERQPWFYYGSWWPDTAWRDTTSSFRFFRLSWYYHRNMMHYMYTDHPLTIVGLAVVAYGVDERIHLWNRTDTMLTSEYLMLCDAHPDTFETKAMVQFDLRDSHWTARTTDWYKYVTPPFPPCGEEFREDFVPLYKYYFDSAVTVEDSFYVGMTKNWMDVVGNEQYWYKIHLPKLIIHVDSSPPTCPPMPSQKYRSCENGVVQYWTTHPYGKSYELIFPLLGGAPEPAPPCPRVDVVRAAVQEDGVCLIWSWGTDSLHVGWEVAWGLAGTPPDSCATVECSSPQTVLEGVDRGVRYVAYVRAMCRHRGNEYYSEWSDSVEVYLPNRYTVVAEANYAERGSVEGGGEYEEGETAVLAARAWRPYNFQRWDDGDSVNPRRVVVTQDTVFTALFVNEEGIATADSLERTVTLMPNPAKERVKVLSGCGLKGVEVLDAQGRTVMSQNVEGHAAELDISQWAAGSYVVKIYTERGIVSKRLVVE